MKKKRAGVSLRRVTSSDPFESPKTLLDWAYEDFREFVSIEKAFFATEPFERFTEFDPEWKRDAHRLRFTSEPPPKLRKLVSHIVSDLRHALDQATFAAASHFGWAPTKKKNVIYFPWADSPTDLERRLETIPIELHPVFRDIKPYPAQEDGSGGDDLFRYLGNIAGPNKHEVALASAGGVQLQELRVNWNDDWCIPYKQWDDAKQQLTFGYFSPGTKGDYDFKLSAFVAFANIKRVQGWHVAGILAEWGESAKDAVRRLEGRVNEPPLTGI